MNDPVSLMLVVAEATGVFAPMAFILLHVLRSFLFVPVAVLCMIGGMLFGALLGTLYTLIGLTLVSVLFYFCIGKMPKTFQKLTSLKEKWVGPYRKLTAPQIALLRLLPFIHYHLMSFCLMEQCKSFKRYMQSSIYVNVPLAVFYTVFGQFIRQFSPTISVMVMIALMALIYILREKVSIIKWQEFFKQPA